jgi:hypothetical protein
MDEAGWHALPVTPSRAPCQARHRTSRRSAVWALILANDYLSDQHGPTR